MGKYSAAGSLIYYFRRYIFAAFGTSPGNNDYIGFSFGVFNSAGQFISAVSYSCDSCNFKSKLCRHAGNSIRIYVSYLTGNRFFFRSQKLVSRGNYEHLQRLIHLDSIPAQCCQQSHVLSFQSMSSKQDCFALFNVLVIGRNIASRRFTLIYRQFSVGRLFTVFFHHYCIRTFWKHGACRNINALSCTYFHICTVSHLNFPNDFKKPGYAFPCALHILRAYSISIHY